MGRGILFGAFWGIVVGGIVLAVASLMGEVPATTGPDPKVVEVPAGSQFDQAGVDRPLAAPAQDAPVEAPSDAPLVTAPAAPVAPTLGGETTSPAAVPQTGGAPTISTPQAGALDSGVVVRLEEAPEDESGASASMGTPVEDDPAPVTDTASAPLQLPEAPQADPVEEAAAADPAAQPVDEGASELAEQPTETAQEPEIEPVPEPLPETSQAATEVAPAAEGTEDTEDQAAEVEAEEPNPATEITAPVAPTEDRVTALPQANSGGFSNRAEGVVVNRPSLSSVPSVTDTPATDPQDEDPTAIAGPMPAIQQFGQRGGWDATSDRPLFSIIMIDEAADGALLGALASFDGPLTFAVPAAAPNATEAMARYRAAGHEVAILSDLPAGAVATDIEVAMQSSFDAVPEAMAVIDGSFTGFSGDRRVAEQVTEILAETGHGLVTVNQGLNTTVQLAQRAGVPTGTVFRDLDGKGQGNTVIRRFLDQAAFRASQDGSAILIARMRPETISALLIWHQQDRADRVTLAPLSAVLLSSNGS